MNHTETKFRNVKLKTDVLKASPPPSKATSSVLYEYPNEKIFMKRKMTNRVKTEKCTESNRNMPGVFYQVPEQKPESKYCELR